MHIAIVGTGNVAYHLAKRLIEVGSPPAWIGSRSLEKGKAFVSALRLDAEIITNADLSRRHPDFIIFAVPDREIEPAVHSYRFDTDSILIHVSGAQSIDLLKAKSNKYGVLYPFQTFSKAKPVNFDEIPLLIEGNSGEAEEEILKLANLLGPKVRRVNSHQRLKVHLAAVFACNFTNYMYHAAENILQDSGIMVGDFEHLMRETVDKALELTPRQAQTGPAIRGDEEVLKKHADLLKDNQDLQELYQLISHQIAKLRL